MTWRSIKTDPPPKGGKSFGVCGDLLDGTGRYVARASWSRDGVLQIHHEDSTGYPDRWMSLGSINPVEWLSLTPSAHPGDDT